jgi:AcrR family transcriptional regulator
MAKHAMGTVEPAIDAARTAVPRTERGRQKAARREQLLHAAARLFAERGFRAVSIEDLGAAAGVSGPALYRHFAGKEAILADLLVGVSRQLLQRGVAEATAGGTPRQTLERLVARHADFALREPELIRIQDRDLTSLPARHADAVRRLQRAYIDVWVSVLLELDPSQGAAVARTRAQAAFGLLNSTPHSASHRDTEVTRQVLESMAMAGLVAPAPALPQRPSTGPSTSPV